MPTSCCVIGCKSSGTTPGIHFFQLPLNRSKILSQWLIVLDRRDWIPKQLSKICSLHFSTDDYFQKPNQSAPRLKPDAIPSVFPDLSSSNEEPNEPSTKIKENIKTPKTKKQEIFKENVSSPTLANESRRPKRVSKLNVKMKDFILYQDEIKKPKVNSPSHVSNKTPPPPPPSEKEKAAQELLSILEDSNSLSSDESGTGLDISSEKTVLNNVTPTPALAHNLDLTSNMSNIKSNVKDKCSVEINNSSSKSVPISNKDLKENINNLSPTLSVNDSTPKVVSPSKSLYDKASIQNLVNPQIETDLKKQLSMNQTEVNAMSLSNSVTPGIPKANVISATSRNKRNKYYQIKEGGKSYYFSYADLNPVVDMSKSNHCLESDNNAKQASRKTKTINEHVDGSDIAIESNISVVSAINEVINRSSDKSDDAQMSESGSVEYFPPATKEVKKKKKGRPCKQKPVNENNKTSSKITNNVTAYTIKPVTNSIEVPKNSDHSTESGSSDPNNIPDEGIDSPSLAEEVNSPSNNNEHGNIDDDGFSESNEVNSSHNSQSNKNKKNKILPQSKRKKRFKTVAEIVVRTDNTGQVPSVSIDKINSLVDLSGNEAPKKKAKRGSTKEVNASVNVTSIPQPSNNIADQAELDRLSARITDTIKKMQLLNNVKGHASKLTVLITTLPPVRQKEILIIKKKNLDTNEEQIRELEVAISSYKVPNCSSGSQEGNNSPHKATYINDHIPVVAACNKGEASIDTNSNHVIEESAEQNSSKRPKEPLTNSSVNENSPPSNVSVDNCNPITPVTINIATTPSLNSSLRPVTIEQIEQPATNNSEEQPDPPETVMPLRHDHTYISPSLKVIEGIELTGDDQLNEKISQLKLTDDEILYRHKLHRKVRSLTENVKRKSEAVNKLKEKVKFLEKTIRDERKSKRRIAKLSRGGASLESDPLFNFENNDIIDEPMEYGLNNVELPMQFDENAEAEDSDDEPKDCSSPITYLCEPAIDICEEVQTQE